MSKTRLGLNYTTRLFADKTDRTYGYDELLEQVALAGTSDVYIISRCNLISGWKDLQPLEISLELTASICSLTT